MYTLDELKKESERLKKQGTPYLGRVLYESDEKKIEVYPYFGGNAEGLYYLVNEGTPNARIYYLTNYETGESEDLKEYIEKYLPIEIENENWRKERKAQEQKEAEEKAEYERFNGFTDSMTPMQKGRAIKILTRQALYNKDPVCRGGVMRRAEWIESMQESGKAESRIVEINGKKEYRIYHSYDEHTFFVTVTKTEYNYFNFLVDKLNSL